jgi:hypothetical protein
VKLSLGNGTDTRVVEASSVVPGASNRSHLTVRNTGTDSGTLWLVNVSGEDYENGYTEPERGVDDSPNEGDLSDVVELRVYHRSPSGPVYLVGSETEYVTYATVRASSREHGGGDVPPDRARTLVIEWRLPSTVGNEVQTDRIEFDLTFALRSETE